MNAPNLRVRTVVRLTLVGPAAMPRRLAAEFGRVGEVAVEISSKGFPLMMADEGARVRITALMGGKGLSLRLTELGLNLGAEISVVQRRAAAC